MYINNVDDFYKYIIGKYVRCFVLFYSECDFIYLM